MKPQSTHGGRRPGAGRKSTRPVSKQPVYLFVDQMDKYGTAEKVREALDKSVNFVHVTDDGRRFEGKAVVTTEPGFEPDVLILTCEEQDEPHTGTAHQVRPGAVRVQDGGNFAHITAACTPLLV